MKELKDYLHLYLGQEIQFKRLDWVNWTVVKLAPAVLEDILSFREKAIQFKLILRPLSDMQPEEFRKICKILDWDGDLYDKEWFLDEDNAQRIILHSSFELTIYLLKQGFDLFGLIESNIAIDKTTLKH